MRIWGRCGIVAGLIGGLVAGALAGGPTAARADGHPVVVELFTSQGCSACPPADALMRELASYDRVIPLALHVDYWDYIGWADIFARPENTVRQKAYAAAVGERMIYTPQIIVNGTARLMGARPMEVVSTVAAEGEVPPRVTVTLERTEGRLTILAPALAEAPLALRVHLVRFTPEATVEILRGENAGRTLPYTNIVTAWDVVADWDGAEDLALEVALEGEAPAAVLLQEPGPGAILGAAVAR